MAHHMCWAVTKQTPATLISVVKLHHLTFCHQSNNVPQFSHRQIGAAIVVPS